MPGFKDFLIQGQGSNANTNCFILTDLEKPATEITLTMFQMLVLSIHLDYVILIYSFCVSLSCLQNIILNLIHKLLSLLLLNALSKVAFIYYFPNNEETYVHYYSKKQYRKFLLIFALLLFLSLFFIFKIASLILRNLNNLHFQSWFCVKKIANSALISTVFRHVDTTEELLQERFFNLRNDKRKRL